MTARRLSSVTADSAPPVYRLEFQAGRPVFTGDGKPISSAAYCDFILGNKDEWIARYRDFVESGVHTYFLDERRDWEKRTTQYWSDEGVYPEPAEGGDTFCLDAEARAVLAMRDDPQGVAEPTPRRDAARQRRTP